MRTRLKALVYPERRSRPTLVAAASHAQWKRYAKNTIRLYLKWKICFCLKILQNWTNIYIHITYSNFISFSQFLGAFRFSVNLKLHFDSSTRTDICTYSINEFCMYRWSIYWAVILICLYLRIASYHVCTWPEHHLVTVCTSHAMCVNSQTSITLLLGTTAQLVWHNPTDRATNTLNCRNGCWAWMK
jgi:hypothetical protein